MNVHTPYCWFFSLCLIVAVSGCEPVADPEPASCDYSTPQLAYTPAGACEPKLVWLRALSRPQEGKFPELPAKCDQAGELGRIVEVPAPPRSGGFTLHVYNGSEAYAYVQVFGAESCVGDFVPLTDCVADNRVGFKVPVVIDADYERYFVRIDLATSGPDEDYKAYFGSEDNFVALAAYDGRQPSFAGRMEYNKRENQVPGQAVVPPPTLPVSCTGLTFHRLIFSSCGSGQDLAAWADEMGLPVSEAYGGKEGSVVAADAPEGMSLQTIGGAAKQKRPSQDTTGTSVEPDYIISLFNPDDPNNYFSGDLERITLKNEKIQNCVAFKPTAVSTSDEEQVIVSIIDSGVDFSPANLDYWNATKYRQAVKTNFMQAGQLGFDFINNDVEPEDVSPHGTFVAGAVVGGYRGSAPLTTINFKIFGADKAATYFGALVAINEAIALNSDVVNMSWGFYSKERPAALECLVKQAADRGVVLVTSAGNEGNNIHNVRQWPASFAADYPETVVSVASYAFENETIDPTKVILTDFSNRGIPDVAVAAFMTTETPNYGGIGTGYFLGTSISTPIVTRTLANLESARPADVNHLQGLYDQGPQLSGLVFKEAYLPVCLEGYTP
ncbi:subtilase family protein [Neolewinella xylanilytica]|uniref:Subtilase family protein n=1 Tax=Neolewinella xylanilytica TaxID=1514080 RepID=A0A2S6I7N3_9BACT|nr:S8 family serine peptidase [Neolewinella xylanilytica]PPK87506.1 subtilase family protein [Neolewinella xylanilytica]